MIIHFTNNINTLLSIIETQSLQLKYCKEDYYLSNKIISSAIHPMVCFSQYSLKEIDKKIITYGKFGIAFKKNWITKNNIHSVLYLEKSSLIAESLAVLLKARRLKGENNLPHHVKLAIMTIKCFTKNSSGYNSHLGISDFNFKSENEWRYVPQKSQIGDYLISQSKSKYILNESFYNNKLIPFPLKFNINDIEFIFVQSKSQVVLVKRLLGVEIKKIKVSNWRTSSNN